MLDTHSDRDLVSITRHIYWDGNKTVARDAECGGRQFVDVSGRFPPPEVAGGGSLVLDSHCGVYSHLLAAGSHWETVLLGHFQLEVNKMNKMNKMKC